jgi:hypothetical protein
MEMVDPSAGKSEMGQAAPPARDYTRAEANAEAADQDLAAGQEEASTQGEATAERKVIREQELEIDVQNLSQVLSRLEQLASEMEGAFIESIEQWQEEVSPQQTRHRALVVLRIPVDQSSEVLAKLEGEGNVLRRTSYGQDVTEEYVDNQSRLRNLHRHEERLLELYDQAENVEEMLKLEAELSRIREQVEIIEGRQRYLDRVTSTVRITLQLVQVEEKEYLGRKQNEPLMAEAWAGLRESLETISYGAKRTFVFLISALPYLILILAVLLPIFWWIRRRFVKNNHSS